MYPSLEGLKPGKHSIAQPGVRWPCAGRIGQSALFWLSRRGGTKKEQVLQIEQTRVLGKS